MIEPKMAPGDYVDWSKEIPKELWEQIIIQSENPALITTCTLFKEIIYDTSITLRKLEANFKDRFTSTFFKAKNENNIIALNEARKLLIERLSRTIAIITREEFKNKININYYTFTKVLDEEYCSNLIALFLRFIPYVDLDVIYDTYSVNERIEMIHSILNKQNFSVVKDLKVLQGNLTYIPKEIKLFTGLETINLSGNKITFIPEDFGNTWNHLNTINLSENKLQTLSEGFGKNWTHLKTIDLRQNEINSLPSDFGSFWKDLEVFGYFPNPLKIDKNEIREKTNQNVFFY